MKKYVTLVFFLLSGLLLSAQTITQFDLSAQMDRPQTVLFAENGNGDIWFAYSYFDFGQRVFAILTYDGNSWTEVDTLPCETCIRDMNAGPDGKIYLAADAQGVYRWDDSVWTQIVTEKALAIEFDSQGELFFMNEQGLNQLVGGTTVTPANNQGLPSNIVLVNDMLFDEDDQIWMLLPSKLYTQNQADGWLELTDNISPLQIDLGVNNRLYMADGGGQVNYYQNGTYNSNVVTGVFPTGLSFTDFVVDGGNILYAGTQGTMPGVMKYDGNSSQLFTVADLLPGAILVSNLFVANNNDIWVASRDVAALARIDGVATNIQRTSSEISLHPDPISHSLKLFGVETGDLLSWSIANVTGQQVQKGELSPQTGSEAHISVSHLPSGLYVFQAEQGGKIYQQKFMWGR